MGEIMCNENNMVRHVRSITVCIASRLEPSRCISKKVASGARPCDKEAQWYAGRHKQELEQEVIKGTRTTE